MGSPKYRVTVRHLQQRPVPAPSRCGLLLAHNVCAAEDSSALVHAGVSNFCYVTMLTFPALHRATGLAQNFRGNWFRGESTMSTVALTDELAHWLRGLLNSNQTDESGTNRVVIPDDVRDALIKMQFVREQPDSIEVTEHGIDAMWQYTLSQRIKIA